MANSTTSRTASKPSKPKKPSAGLPPLPPRYRSLGQKHQRQVSILRQVADDPEGEKARVLWNEQKDDLLAGRTPRV